MADTDNNVIGIVVSKHAPISLYHQQAIEALAQNSNGVCFAATDENGNSRRFVESQIVAELLDHLRSLTQVMIGESIAVEELKSMLQKIDITPITATSKNCECRCGSGKDFKKCCGMRV